MAKKESRFKRRKIGYKEWWNQGCSKRKRSLHKLYGRWRRGKIERERYIEERRKMRTDIEERRRKWVEDEERELKDLKNSADIWRYINRKRGAKEFVNNKIGRREWEEHFRTLLDGEVLEEKNRVEERHTLDGGGEDLDNEGEEKDRREEEIEAEDINKAIRKMKRKKAAGIDRLPMEAWLYGGEAIKKRLVEIMNQIWKGEDMPRDWRTSEVVPIFYLREGIKRRWRIIGEYPYYVQHIRYMHK